MGARKNPGQARVFSCGKPQETIVDVDELSSLLLSLQSFGGELFSSLLSLQFFDELSFDESFSLLLTYVLSFGE